MQGGLPIAILSPRPEIHVHLPGELLAMRTEIPRGRK